MENKEFYLYIEGKPVKVSEEVYREYYRGERKERYFMEDLKKGRTKPGSGIGDKIYLPSREVSYEGMLERQWVFAEEGEPQDERVTLSILLEQAMEGLPADERSLIRELYYAGKTEREASAALHIAQATLHRKRERALKRMREFLGEIL